MIKIGTNLGILMVLAGTVAACEFKVDDVSGTVIVTGGDDKWIQASYLVCSTAGNHVPEQFMEVTIEERPVIAIYPPPPKSRQVVVKEYNFTSNPNSEVLFDGVVTESDQSYGVVLSAANLHITLAKNSPSKSASLIIEGDMAFALNCREARPPVDPSGGPLKVPVFCISEGSADTFEVVVGAPEYNVCACNGCACSETPHHALDRNVEIIPYGKIRLYPYIKETVTAKNKVSEVEFTNGNFSIVLSKKLQYGTFDGSMNLGINQGGDASEPIALRCKNERFYAIE